MAIRIKPSQKINEIAKNEKLAYIRKILCGVTEERIIAAVFIMKKPDIIDELLNKFTQMNNTFSREFDNLKHNAETHNKKYANNDNLRFTTAQIALLDIKTSIQFLYTLNTQYTPKTRPGGIWNQSDTSTIEYKMSHSIVGGLPYTIPMYELQSDQEKRLVTEIMSFIRYIDKCLEICQNTIAQEEKIGSDEYECLQLLHEQIEEAFQYIKNHTPNVDYNDNYIQDLLIADSEPKNACKWFHKLLPSHIANVAIARYNITISKYPKKLFKLLNGDIPKLEKFDKAMKHVDEYVQGDSIPGEFIYNLKRYIGGDCSDRGFYNCFKDTYTQNGGTHRIVTIQAVGVAKKALLKADDSSYTELENYFEGIS